MTKKSDSPMTKFLAKLVEESAPTKIDGKELRICIIDDNAHSFVPIPEISYREKKSPVRCRSVPTSPPAQLKSGRCGRLGDIVRVIDIPTSLSSPVHRWKSAPIMESPPRQLQRITDMDRSPLDNNYQTVDLHQVVSKLQLPLLNDCLESPTSVLRSTEANTMWMNISPHLDIDLEAYECKKRTKKTIDHDGTAEEETSELNQRLIQA
jgi:hypothetical protein